MFASSAMLCKLENANERVPSAELASLLFKHWLLAIMATSYCYFYLYLQEEFVHCESELQVTFYSFSNPDGLLAKKRCCDFSGQQCRSDVCDSFFSFCLRSINAPVSSAEQESNINSICSNIMSTLPLTDTNSALISNSSLGIPNPVSLYGYQLVKDYFFIVMVRS